MAPVPPGFCGDTKNAATNVNGSTWSCTEPGGWGQKAGVGGQGAAIASPPPPLQPLPLFKMAAPPLSTGPLYPPGRSSGLVSLVSAPLRPGPGGAVCACAGREGRGERGPSLPPLGGRFRSPRSLVTMEHKMAA